MRMPRDVGLRARARRRSRRAARRSVAGSRGSGPAIAAVSSAASSTLCASGPIESSVVDSGTTPARLTRPYVGLESREAAQRRRECASSRRCRSRSRPGTSPAATATAEPLDDPPGDAVRRRVPRIPRRAHRLVAAPAAERELDHVRLAERDHARRRPGARPRSRCRRTMRPRQVFEPAVVWRPARCSRSLSAIGRPCSGPRGIPAWRSRSAASARASALVAVDVDERVQAAVEPRDALEAGLDDLDRRHVAAFEVRLETGQRMERQIVRMRYRRLSDSVGCTVRLANANDRTTGAG